MNLMNISHKIMRWTDDGLYAIEQAARTCYLSEPKDTPQLREEWEACSGILGMKNISATLREVHFQKFVQEKFLTRIRKKGHQTPFEFMDIEVGFICDRGVSHELVRHRIASPMQESTRYCNYQKYGKHGLNIIQPSCFKENAKTEIIRWADGSDQLANRFMVWLYAMEQAEWAYNQLIDMGTSPQEARSVLPNSLKTKILIKTNVREWWHIFKERSDLNPGAHPQMKEMMTPVLNECVQRWPVLFSWLVEK